MAKNKGKYHSGEASAPPPNEELVTLTNRAVSTLRPHATKIVAVLVGVVVVLSAVSIWGWYDKRRQTRATAGVLRALDLAHAEVSETPDPNAKKEDVPTFATEQARDEATLAELQKVEKSYGKAKIAKSASLVQAGILYDMGKYDEAAKAYEAYAKSATDPELKLIAREGQGYAQEAKALAAADASAREAGLKQALATFEALQPDDKGYYRDMALFHQARIHQALGHKDDAVKLYKAALDKTQRAQLRKQIANRLAVLEDQA